jgi:hypothetical protein
MLKAWSHLTIARETIAMLVKVLLKLKTKLNTIEDMRTLCQTKSKILTDKVVLN